MQFEKIDHPYTVCRYHSQVCSLLLKKDEYVSAILNTLYHCKCNLEPELNCVLLYARTFMQGEHKYIHTS